MTQVKTSTLEGEQLDWVVQQLEIKELEARGEWVKPWWKEAVTDAEIQPGRFSTDWLFAGPIIEREDISFRKYHNPKSPAHGTYHAKVCRESGTTVRWKGRGAKVQTGPTPLVAAMRCYVAEKLGEVVDIPDQLKGEL